MRVRAIERGFDNLCVREVGDEFDMPDDVFAKRQKLDNKGQPVKGQYYDPPSWFEPVDEAERAKLGPRAGTGATVPAVDPAVQAAARESALRDLGAADGDAAKASPPVAKP